MNKSKLLQVILVLLVVFPLGASVTGGTGGLRTASTEHFDIIYQEQSKETAALLFENCENTYVMLVEFFGVDPELHLPVVVTSQYKSLNAYFTNYTANHIVMFDTVSDGGQLSNYPQTILYIFRHELTHAFQFNIRGPFFGFLSDVFGDFLSLSPIAYMYPSLSEGGAVLTESMDGYGRLNDSYSMQIVRQAKIEGLFPTWLEVSGARDTYPSGLLYYNFAAAFLEYLAKTYGYDKVASLYVDFSKLGWSTFTKFRDVFGLPVEQAWQQFYSWVEVPSETKEGGAVASRTESGSYASPVLDPEGNLFVYDYSTSEVLKFSSDLAACDRVMVINTDEQHLSISADGRRLLVSRITDYRADAILYDISGRKARKLHTFSDVRKAGFVSLSGTEYILVYYNEGQNTFLRLHDGDTFEPVEGKSIRLGYDVIAYDFISMPGDRVAFVQSHASHQNLAILDLSDMSVRLIANPDDISILSLSKGSDGSSDVLSFCWCPADAKATNLCRYGELRLSDQGAEICLSDADVSGGITNPIRINDSVLFTARYFETLKLKAVTIDDLSLQDSSSYGFEDRTDAPAPDTTSLSEASKRYRAIKYFKDGILFPFAILSIGSQESMTLGATWLTTDPTETYSHQISAGYMVSQVVGSYTFSSTSLIPYSLHASAIYGTGVFAGPDTLQKGDFLFDAGADASVSFELSPSGSTLKISDSFKMAGMKTLSTEFEYGMSNYLSMTYSYSRKTGMNHYDTFGLSTTAYLSDLTPGARFSMKFPRLLWWKCDGPNVTNLPFSFSVDAAYDWSNNMIALDGTVSVVLFSHEIQRAIPLVLFGLQFKRFSVDLKYNAFFVSGINAFRHSLSITAAYTLTPVLGEYLTKLNVKLGATFETDFEDCSVRVAFGTNL